jgi:hypothetical protein
MLETAFFKDIELIVLNIEIVIGDFNDYATVFTMHSQYYTEQFFTVLIREVRPPLGEKSQKCTENFFFFPVSLSYLACTTSTVCAKVCKLKGSVYSTACKSIIVVQL